jgi:hypothetical protein
MAEEFKFDAFISYSHSDREFAELLLKALEKRGLKVAIDYKDFSVGAPVLREMNRLILTSRHIIIVLSPDFLRSEWTEFEVVTAQAIDPSSYQRKIIPVMHRDVKLPSRLNHLVSLDFTKTFDVPFEKLTKAISPRFGDQKDVAEEKAIPPSNEIMLEIRESYRQILESLNQMRSHSSSTPLSIFGKTDGIVDSNLCFVLMPFGPKWSRKLFEQHIKPTGNKLGFDVLRADDIYGVSGIMHDVWIYINRARIIIADLTTRNPNVFYEVGLAHAIGKDVILITQDMADVPFDLQSLRCVVYSLELDSPDKFCVDLENTIKAILKKV